MAVVRVRVRFMGRFSWQLIIDSRMPVHDPPGSGSGYRFTCIHNQQENSCCCRQPCS